MGGMDGISECWRHRVHKLLASSLILKYNSQTLHFLLHSPKALYDLFISRYIENHSDLHSLFLIARLKRKFTALVAEQNKPAE